MITKATIQNVVTLKYRLYQSHWRAFAMSTHYPVIIRVEQPEIYIHVAVHAVK